MRGDVGLGRAAPGLAALLVLSPLPFGSVHGAPASVLAIAVWTLGLVCWVRAPGWSAGMPRAVPIIGAVLILWIAVALVPLPRAVIEGISPATAALYGATIDTVSSAAAWPLAIHPFETRSELLRYTVYGTAFVLASTASAPRLLIRASVATGVLVSLLAILQGLTWNGMLLWFFEPFEGRTYHPRLSGPFVNADHFALLLEMTLVVGASWLLQSLRRGSGRGVVLPALGLGVVAAALLGSASRGGISGAAIGLALFLWGSRRVARPSAPNATAGKDVSGSRDVRRHRSRSRSRSGEASPAWTRADVRHRLERWASRLAPAAVIVTIIVGGLVYAGPQAREILDLRLGRTITTPDLHVRTIYWVQTLPLIGDFPVAGVGAGGWRDLFPRYQRYPMPDMRPNHAHGDYVEWVAETGLVGAGLWLALGAAVAAWAWGNPSIPRTLRWGLLGALTAVAWHEVFDFGLRIPANALHFAVLAGLLCNRRWDGGGRDSASAPAPPDSAPGRRSVVVAMGFGLYALLVLTSLVHLRESLLWAEVRGGSIDGSSRPRSAETWYELGVNRQERLRRYDAGTVAAFREAVLRRPAFAHAWWRISRTAPTFAERGRALETALYLHPAKTGWRLAYVRFLAAAGRRDEIPGQIEKAVWLAPRLGEHAYLDPRRATPSQAIVAAAARGFERAIEARPGDAQVLASAAGLRFRFEDWEGAAALYERAARASGDWSRHGLEAAESYVRAENLEAAGQSYRRAIAARPSRPDGYRGLALAVFRAQERWQEGEEILERGLRRADDPVPLWIALYELRAARGNGEKAFEALERAAALRSDDAGLQIRLGDARLSAGDLHRARIAYDRAAALEPAKAAWQERRGRVLERLYDLAGAREAYRRAAALDPGNEAAARSLARVEAAFEELEDLEAPR